MLSHHKKRITCIGFTTTSSGMFIYNIVHPYLWVHEHIHHCDSVWLIDPQYKKICHTVTGCHWASLAVTTRHKRLIWILCNWQYWRSSLSILLVCLSKKIIAFCWVGDLFSLCFSISGIICSKKCLEHGAPSGEPLEIWFFNSLSKTENISRI